ncbi:MAG: T9SS type A sorting domain-containing protein [Chlorobi bacterium]|nr:T9SS type A sorting domain-containing protein [Chlorobiota bacterium]
MKKILFPAVLFVFGFAFLTQAQEIKAPTKVVKAAFFDKTPPLRDMELIDPATVKDTWKDGEVKNESIDMKKFSSTEPTDPNSVQSTFGPMQSKGPVVSIDGVGNVNGVYPPDTDGDVGPNHYFQMINLSFAIYDKVGNKLYGPAANSTLWSGFPGPWNGHNDGDPIVLYDEMADRWMASQFAVQTSNGKSYQMVAISETGDPLGSWYRYAFEFNYFNDYPKMGIWMDGYYASFHMFGGNGFIGSGFAAFERDKMLIGDPDAQMIYFGQYSSKFGFLPCDIDGDPPPAGTPAYFVGINNWTNHNMEIYRFTTDWDTPSNSSFVVENIISPMAFNSNINGVPQPGTSTKLDVLESMLMFRLPFRHFEDYDVMLATHSVKVGTKIGVRWYELRNDGTGWEIYQQGTYAPDNNNRWMGSIAMSANGNIAIGYSVSSSSVYPSIRVAGRTPDAPLGEMNIAEIEIVPGGSSQSGISRWGDYACMSPDPTNDSTFWFTTEYMKSSGWGTRITSFDFAPLQAPEAWAGVDSSSCVNSLFFTSGSALYASSVLWETMGDGIFQNANTLSAKYLRGNGDIANGEVILTLTAYGYEPGQESIDEMLLQIVPEPEANAGDDMNIAVDESAILNGSAENSSSVMWSTAGDGVFDDETLLNATYTPGTADIAAGEVNLTLEAMEVAPCEDSDSDGMILSIGAITDINLQNETDASVSIVPNPSNGKFEFKVSGLQDGNVQVNVVDSKGESVYKSELGPRSGSVYQSIDLSAYPKGIYLLKVKSEGFYKVKKIVIQ